MKRRCSVLLAYDLKPIPFSLTALSLEGKTTSFCWSKIITGGTYRSKSISDQASEVNSTNFQLGMSGCPDNPLQFCSR